MVATAGKAGCSSLLGLAGAACCSVAVCRQRDMRALERHVTCCGLPGCRDVRALVGLPWKLSSCSRNKAVLCAGAGGVAVAAGRGVLQRVRDRMCISRKLAAVPKCDGWARSAVLL